jgi:phosphoribosyl-ATP pyrophosphohydrolase/phosphoribosyl-AMP cyclohydrolase
MKQIKFDEHGLIPAIVQDATTKQVLTLAYMNEESLKRTVEQRETWFYSRSRQELWHKGATSGNIQKVQSIEYDCDADTLLIQVHPAGPACHTGATSCFYQSLDTESPATASVPSNERVHEEDTKRFAILAKLESTIASRDLERPEGAYTTYLFEKGIDKILKKVGEESAEVIIAAKNQSALELRYEASDLIFHLLVLLREAKLPLDDVLLELERRHLQK